MAALHRLLTCSATKYCLNAKQHQHVWLECSGKDDAASGQVVVDRMKSWETARQRLRLVVAVRRKCSKGLMRNAGYYAVFSAGCGPVLLRLKPRSGPAGFERGIRLGCVKDF
jgi:hypothetical protein